MCQACWCGTLMADGGLLMADYAYTRLATCC